jgi:hypothetical protein
VFCEGAARGKAGFVRGQRDNGFTERNLFLRTAAKLAPPCAELPPVGGGAGRGENFWDSSLEETPEKILKLGYRKCCPDRGSWK